MPALVDTIWINGVWGDDVWAEIWAQSSIPVIVDDGMVSGMEEEMYTNMVTSMVS